MENFDLRLKTACKAKSLINVIMLLPRQGAIYSIIYHLPRALPWAGISLAFQAVFAQNPSAQVGKL